MRIKAHAKINLCLDILGKREDGYHELGMIMQELKLHDDILVESIPEKEIQLFIYPGSNADVSAVSSLPSDSGNIVYRAAELMMERCRPAGGIKISLEKNIPVAAGLGGGSADAAAVINAVDEMCGTALSREEKEKLGLQLGADVPFCLRGGTVYSTGIGEKLVDIKSDLHYDVLLVKTGAGISSGEAYKAYDVIDPASFRHPDAGLCAKALESGDEAVLFSEMGNVLEYPALGMVPRINAVKTRMSDLGAEFTMMSGSGPTVFGLFRNKKACSEAACRFEELRENLALTDIIVTGF